MEKCEAGCKVFDGGERSHHKDCFFYPDSLSQMYDKLEKSNAEMLDLLIKIYNSIYHEDIEKSLTEIIEKSKGENK